MPLPFLYSFRQKVTSVSQVHLRFFVFVLLDPDRRRRHLGRSHFVDTKIEDTCTCSSVLSPAMLGLIQPAACTMAYFDIAINYKLYNTLRLLNHGR